MLTLDQFRSRPMTVHTLTRCDSCETLRDDVQSRSNYWPKVQATTCAGCFTRLVAEAQGLIPIC